MMWADVLNPDHPPLAAIGISGDLLFKVEWDVDTTGRKLRAHALVERASGDIRFTAEDSNAANVTIIRSSGASEQRSPNSTQVQSRAFTAGRGVRARVQEMRVLFDANDKDVRAQLHWSTERAGQIHADVRSQIQVMPDGIVWPDSAPLSGTIDAALPNLGVWAFFAPPGWRVSGSFMADLDLFGTRKAPTGAARSRQTSSACSPCSMALTSKMATCAPRCRVHASTSPTSICKAVKAAAPASPAKAAT